MPQTLSGLILSSAPTSTGRYRPVRLRTYSELAEGFLQEGFRPDEVRAITGENTVRFLLKNLPD
jgi:hypothetical protein